jgi:hypothetical protein
MRLGGSHFAHLWVSKRIRHLHNHSAGREVVVSGLEFGFIHKSSGYVDKIGCNKR